MQQKQKHIIITGGAWHHEVFGGAYKAATEFAEYLSGQGHRVSYIAWTREKAVANPTLHRGVEVWRYPIPSGKSPSMPNALGHISASRRLAMRIAAQYPVDHLNGHDFLQFLGASVGMPEKSTGISISVHSPLVQENLAHWGCPSGANGKGLPLKKRLAVRALALFEREAYRRAQIIQTDSRFTLGEISRDYPKAVGGKGVASSLWVDLQRFRYCCSDKSSVRKGLGGPWDSDSPIFFTLRRLVPRMGVDNLIRAMAIMKADGFDCRLIVGGGGPEKENLEALATELGLTDRVFLAGRISDEDLPLCFQAPDCFVLPTRALECFGLIILEAFACGTPVIATPVGSIPEVMGPLGREFLSADTSPEALAENMTRFLEGKIKADPLQLRDYAASYSFEERAGALVSQLMG